MKKCTFSYIAGVFKSFGKNPDLRSIKRRTVFALYTNHFTARIRRMIEGNIFSLFTPGGGWGVPHPADGGGTPILPDWGVPHPSQPGGRGTPSFLMGVPPSGLGYPSIGTGWGHPPIRPGVPPVGTGWRYPHLI